MGRSDSHPGLSQFLAEPELAAAAAGVGLPCCVVFLADVPSPLPRRTRRTGLFGAFDGPLHATAAAFPFSQQGRHPRGFVSRPARRSPLLRPICLLSRQLRPFDVGSFSRFVASSTVPTATGWNQQPPGRDFHPLENDTFARHWTGPNTLIIETFMELCPENTNIEFPFFSFRIRRCSIWVGANASAPSDAGSRDHEMGGCPRLIPCV